MVSSKGRLKQLKNMKYTKNIAAIALAISVFAVSTAPALADGGHGTSGSNANSATTIACMKTAVGTRETSIKTAYTTYNTAVTAAYTARATALAAAWSLTSWSDIKPAIRTAWKDFKNANKTAKRTWMTSEKAAWKKFKTDAKACRAPSDVVDSSEGSGSSED